MMNRTAFSYGCSALLCAGMLAAAGCCESGVLDFNDGFFVIACDFPRTAHNHSTQTIDVEGVTTLRVTSRNGSIEVDVDTTRDDARIESSTFAVADTEDEAQDLLAQIVITIRRTGDNDEILEITVEFPPDDGGSSRHFGPGGRSGASFDIVLPAGLDLELTTQNGPVEVDDNTGSVQIETSNGSIQVEDQTGDVDVQSSNGGIQLLGIEGNVVAHTSNGGIHVEAEPPAGGMIDVDTSNGPVAIRVPTDFAAALDLETSNGFVFVDLDGFDVTDLDQTNRHVTATLNGGGGSITGRTSNGPISFRGL